MNSSEQPLVSVIIRTIDRPKYLVECLISLSRQDYHNIEAVIVNDGGPSIEAMVRELNLEFPIQIREFKHNRGRSIGGNTGMDLAKGKYLCFLDDDDIFYPHHISTLVSKLESANYKVAYSDAVRATQVPRSYNPGTYKTCDSALVYSEDFDLGKLLCEDGNYLPILCVMFEKACLESGIKFDGQMDVLEDWDFWIQLAQEFEFLHIPEITAEYRVRLDGTNTVGQLNHIWDYARAHVRDKYLDLRRSLGVYWNERLP